MTLRSAAATALLALALHAPCAADEVPLPPVRPRTEVTVTPAPVRRSRPAARATRNETTTTPRVEKASPRPVVNEVEEELPRRPAQPLVFPSQPDPMPVGVLIPIIAAVAALIASTLRLGHSPSAPEPAPEPPAAIPPPVPEPSPAPAPRKRRRKRKR